jgi:enamine deaminase RidA (YjgF/YER057c/UK114 family)
MSPANNTPGSKPHGAQNSSKVATTALLPVDVPNTPHRWARGVRAGRWVFATGQCGTDYIHGLAPDVVASGHPFDGPSKAHREARRLFQNVAAVLAEGGSSPDNVVRIDQYYASPDVVDAYHETRREFFNGKIPPSTSNLHRRFSRAGQSMEVQVMAAVPSGNFEVHHEASAGAYKIHPSSGYSPALSAGDFRFVPGQTAEALREEDAPIDPEARRAHGLWKGTPIKLETDFIIRKKLKPTLEAVNAGLDTVVKAQVYLRDKEDIPNFRQIWAQHFAVEPATTIIATATPGFIMPESRIEINTIALAKAGTTTKQVVAPIPPLFQGASTAVRAGDLLFISGLMAVRDGSLVPQTSIDPRQPFFAIPAKAELREILAQAETICAAAGTSLKNAVRIQQFHADLADLPPTLEVWSDAMDGMPLPLSAIEVPWLPVPEARLQLDLWVYIPDQTTAD